MGWRNLNLLQLALAGAWTFFWVPLALLLLVVTWKPALPLILARRCWAPGILWVAGTKLEVTGLEALTPGKPYVFVANHESTLDIPIVFAALPANLHFILKKELLWIPFIGLFAWATGMIFVDRYDKSTAIRSLRKAGRLMRGGKSVLAFPEGTRNRGTILPFKKGVFVAALEASVPVVPLAIVGSAKVMPRGATRATPGQVLVRVGAPFELSTRGAEDRERLTLEARKAVVALYSGKTLVKS